MLLVGYHIVAQEEKEPENKRVLVQSNNNDEIVTHDAEVSALLFVFH